MATSSLLADGLRMRSAPARASVLPVGWGAHRSSQTKLTAAQYTRPRSASAENHCTNDNDADRTDQREWIAGKSHRERECRVAFSDRFIRTLGIWHHRLLSPVLNDLVNHRLHERMGTPVYSRHFRGSLSRDWAMHRRSEGFDRAYRSNSPMGDPHAERWRHRVRCTQSSPSRERHRGPELRVLLAIQVDRSVFR